jgi:peptidoglycan hydrolase-like protein with peptidoglycan-binding domain
MWNGKRFNTDYKGTPQQQLKETGLTNEQIQDRSKLNKNLTKNIYPYSYDNLEKRIWAAGVLGKKEENREAIDKDPRPYDKEKLDALNLYAGVPQKNNTFRISNYKPSTSKDNINYYTFNKQDDRFVKNLIDYAYLKSKGAIDGSAKDYDIDVKGLVPDQEKNVMGNYKMSTGKDDRGTYVSFYDKWDLALMDFGKPFEIYDRIYTKDYSDGKQKRMYYTDKELLELDINKKNFDTLALQRELANRGYKLSKSTKKDGIFDGILGEETKKALEDWQKKNFKKQFGGALLKAQFGAFGTIPTSPPFMPQKENVVTSKKVDNLPKIKVNTTVPDEMITIKDGRKIRLTTGQAINPNTDLVGKSYSTKALRSILNTAKNRGLSKDDALTLAAMDLQETRWGETDDHMGHVLYGNNSTISPAENFINAYLRSKETANRLKLSDEYTRLQVYNGLGKVTPNTEKDYHGFRMKKIYGVPVPESGIDMKKNPLYGKQIVDIRDNVLKQNPEFLKLVDEYYKMGGITNEMLDVYKNYINGVYTNTEKEKDAIKVYDKLNRKYYREAKNANKSVPNYIMSLIK